jgi:hypothetical protein
MLSSSSIGIRKAEVSWMKENGTHNQGLTHARDERRCCIGLVEVLEKISERGEREHPGKESKEKISFF